MTETLQHSMRDGYQASMSIRAVYILAAVTFIVGAALFVAGTWLLLR